MANIIDRKVVVEALDGASVNGFVLVKNYSELPTKTGSSYLAGNLEAKGEVPFKVWKNSNCFEEMQGTDYSGKICSIEAVVNEWGDMNSLIIRSIREVPEERLKELGISKADFLKEKYDANSYYNALRKAVEIHTSAEALEIFDMVISDIKDRFTTEYAAINYHDNCKSGLLAHTTKVVKLAAFVKMYPEIMKRVSADVLYVGTALHDIGKIYEYNTGVISEQGKRVSHLLIGAIMLEKYKDKIIELKGEEFYWTLFSIISQHHGEFGEQPRTVAAYIIHQLDLVDSTLALLNQKLEESTSGDGQISFNNMKLI